MTERPQLTRLGKLVIILFVLACLGGAGLAFHKRWQIPSLWPAVNRSALEANDHPRPGGVEIGIAYGTEKKLWLEWAVQEFAKTREGEGVSIHLIPMGTLEGAQALVGGDERIHAWSPASGVCEDDFRKEWSARRGGKPISRREDLALTPMVFVMWEERYQAFSRERGAVSFESIRKALQEQSGWGAIAGKPEWGLLKFGHTHPGQSNSGIQTLVAMAYEFHHKTKGLAVGDIVDPAFQDWVGKIESGASARSNSTGNLMREMVLKGPSSFDLLFVYESVAIDYLKSAEGRWGAIRVVYPERNLWNENPYYVLDAPWSSTDQKKAASAFLDFLLDERAQREALVHGFRPGNPAIPVRAAGSPFSLYASHGLRVDLSQVCETPSAEVVKNLLASWERRFGER
jgi:ABC-type Fe3+ transport system substrate-binding protein